MLLMPGLLSQQYTDDWMSITPLNSWAFNWLVPDGALLYWFPREKREKEKKREKNRTFFSLSF